MNKNYLYKSFFLVAVFMYCNGFSFAQKSTCQKATGVLKMQTIHEADSDCLLRPVTITSVVCTRSKGSKHDFYSEGDYWWPDPENPAGPYIRKDGQSNPDNFSAHRLLVIRFGKIIGALASAYKITGNTKYIRAAVPHLKAWFEDTATSMHPSLNYAQAIKGLYKGRGIGIIDAVHLMEVARGVYVMQHQLDRDVLSAAKKWFAAYLHWLMTSSNGKAEMNEKNNHGTCFVMQAACFAQLINDTAIIRFCRERYKTVLLPEQMASDGSFPLELARTKPYGYAIFNLDAMATLCQILSDKNDNLFNYQTPDGRSLKKGIDYLFPFIQNKKSWKLKPDIMYWDQWPVAQPFLLFGAAAYNNIQWFDEWKSLDHCPEIQEVVRNLPVKYPLIWMH